MSSSRPLAIVTVLRQALDMSLPNAACGGGLTWLSQPTSRPSMKRRGNSAAWAPRSRPSNGSRDDRRFDRLYRSIQGRPVDALLANAGHGLGKGPGSKFRRRMPCRRYQCDRHSLSLTEGGARYAGEGEGTDSYYRFTCRLHIGGMIRRRWLKPASMP